MEFETLETARLKFYKSKNTGELIAFVSRLPVIGILKGVRENSVHGKKICVLSEDLKGVVERNVLYDCELKHMLAGKKGYVVVSAQQVMLEAVIETILIPKTIYQVCVSFGNKTVYFDPKDGRSPSSRTIEGVVKVLRRRRDLEDTERVVEEFIVKAKLLVRRMEQDGYIVP